MRPGEYLITELSFFFINYLLAFGYKLLFVSRCIVSNIFASVKNYLFIYN